MRAKPNFASEFLDPVPQRWNDPAEHITPEVRFGVNQDIGRGTTIDQNLKKAVNRASVLGTCGQLTIGEQPGSTFAVEDVAVEAEDPLLPEHLYLVATNLDIRSPLDEERFPSSFGERQRRHQPGRPGSNHNRAMLSRCNVRDHRHWYWRGGQINTPRHKQQCGLTEIVNLGRQHEAGRHVLAASIDRFAQENQPIELLHAAVQ